MNSFIDFKPQDAKLPSYIRFSITKKAFGNMAGAVPEAISMLDTLSASKVLIITRGKEDGIYEIYTNEGIFLCAISNDCNSLLIIGYFKNSLMKQNNTMKNGVCFTVSSGIIIQIKLTQPYELFLDIVNGKRYEDSSFSSVNVVESVLLIKGSIAASQSKEEEEEEMEEEYQPEKKLVNLLMLAESYSILSNELEEKKANMLGKIPYTSIESLEYDRIDRVAYRFGVSGMDENVFKTGVQVELEDRNQEKHAAEIIEIIKKNSDTPASFIILLFNAHIDITQFHRNGWFNLSFSTVNKDVQLLANEKIKSGEATAKYMDVVLGKNSSAGFENKDLEEIRAGLLQKKYPPNESQMKAIFAGINSKDVFLVMGPPGTGKTTVILEWVKYFVKQEHKRVLVSSQNNKAVDNVLARIADEKDIDIIRIGSESKLQSDVVPYMFENKVKALRESIIGNTVEKVKSIDKITAIWKHYSQAADLGMKLADQTGKGREQFKLAVLNELKPLYTELEELINSYRLIEQQKSGAAVVIRSLYDKILRYESGSGGIMKFLTSFSYKDNLTKIKENVDLYDGLKSRALMVVNRYNALRNKYQKEYDLIKEVDFMRLCLDIQDENNALEMLKVKPEKCAENIWGLFDEPRYFTITSPEDCAKVRKIITKEQERADKLRGALIMWKEETQSQQNYALNEIVLESVDLVGATCIGINSQKRFANLDFDITIIDEAGQIQVHNALVPMSVSNKLIMLGDHKQIPPSADQELMELCVENGVKTQLLEMSLFEKMYQDLPESNKMMLDTQYRMPAEIADTISEWFYEERYFSPDFKKGLKSQIPALSSRPYVIIDTSGEQGSYEKKVEGAGSSNSMEAKIVAELISFIMKNPENDLKEIGVISAYKSQVKLIKNLLSKLLPQEIVSEIAATLDSYQGQERDIIIYSFTKSSDTSPRSRRIGFLNELRRLNVAMTRCRKMLVLVGDMRFLGGCLHCEKNDNEELIYDKSEKQFSDFINKMVRDVKSGRGECISYKEFMNRMKGGDE